MSAKASSKASAKSAKSAKSDQEQRAFLDGMQNGLNQRQEAAQANLGWLEQNMPPYFFISMKEEAEAMGNLAVMLDQVPGQTKLTLLERDAKLILARRDVPGSLYETLKGLRHRTISYAEMTHSLVPMPGCPDELEVQKFEFDMKTPQQITQAGETEIPAGLLAGVRRAMKGLYPQYDFHDLKQDLGLLMLNNPSYVRVSPPERTARLLWLYQRARKHAGLYLSVEQMKGGKGPLEARLSFAVGNPPKTGFLAQAMETLARLDIGVRRFYATTLTTRHHTYFLGNFYVVAHDGEPIHADSPRFSQLKNELYNTQILDTASQTYRLLVPSRVLTGEEASLTNAFIAFCHTSLAHNQPDRYSFEEVESAFLAQPAVTIKFIELFRARFDPGLKKRDARYKKLLAEAQTMVTEFNTGYRRLDELRRTIYRVCLLFIEHTLKTNFFVPEKHALAFRLDPAYLSALGSEFTADLPETQPFRVSFFFSRFGVGYHIGFSDIARGGWRTVICRSRDEYTTGTNNLFREVFVLAHTQHLKNKDIYEGGSKLVVALDAVELDQADLVTQRLYRLQYGLANAFLDLFVTTDGRAADPRVVDYYQDDEPIEIGPDENMHDAMIEEIARLAKKRGYVLGAGIISSKSIGINHKEYGVTSRGVMRFAQIAMGQAGVDITKDPFTVRITGGPFGDVAGNCMKLILVRCPQAAIMTITDGAGALYDPAGADRKELSKHLLINDIVAFDPEALHEGGFLLYRQETKQEELRTLYKKVVREAKGLKTQWITNDEFQRELDHLLFAVKTDLFMPCGGRPETIDAGNWQRLFNKAGEPSCRVIVEGANSFITPAAREEIQKKGVVLLRDASANKCGVISSSYEIIANLLMSDQEFLKNKDAYVEDVLAILEKRAQDEAHLIFRRHEQENGAKLFTAISAELSQQMNRHYARFFDFFQSRPELLNQKVFHNVLLSHLPEFVRQRGKYRARVKNLPAKIKFAILASETASFIVYQGNWDSDLEGRLKGYLKPYFG